MKKQVFWPKSEQVKMTEEEKQKDLSQVVQGTAENLLNQLEENLKVQEEELLQSSEPGPLDKEGKNVEDVLNIISQSIFREGEGHILLKLCDRPSLLSVVSHSLSAYITTLEPLPLQRLSARIASEVSLWMCDLFHFNHGAAFCCDDTREGLVRITRMALHKQYPKMCQDGFEALFSRPPVIYLTSGTYLDIANYVCVQLGLPQSTIKVLRPDMDKEEAFEALINEDRGSGRLPILCIANVHSSLFQSFTPSKFTQICKKNGLWTHLEGHALAALALLDAQNQAPEADSLSLTIGSWIGVPAVPFVTLYKIHGMEEIAAYAGLSTVNPSVRLNCLPLWCVLRSLGENQFKSRINNIFEMMEVLNNKMSEFACIRILCQRPENKDFINVQDVAKNDFDTDLVFKTVSPALAFQYVSNNAPDPNERVPDYFNNLNSWLGQTMQRDCGQIPLEIVDVETTGYVLRLCPFESLSFSGVSLTEDDLEAFIIGLENQTSILNATVCQREKFIELINAEEKIEMVEIPHWAGLGGVCYIPPELRKRNEPKMDPEQPHVYTSDELQLINQRNLQLVNQLRTLDSAFSLGEGGSGDGRMCIRFGMVSMDTDVEELLNLVTKTGTDLDEQVNQLHNMSELVKQGIEQAQSDLRKESDEAIWNEGLLRHVPLVGSIYNWISPAQKMQIKGRTLQLNEGRLSTSDVLYKKPPLDEPNSDEKTQEISIVEETNAEIDATE